ncbi:MAG: ABC transporter ATP-binding protein [Candidatus Moraniibacteriota bacterium]
MPKTKQKKIETEPPRRQATRASAAVTSVPIPKKTLVGSKKRATAGASRKAVRPKTAVETTVVLASVSVPKPASRRVLRRVSSPAAPVTDALPKESLAQKRPRQATKPKPPAPAPVSRPIPSTKTVNRPSIQKVDQSAPAPVAPVAAPAAVSDQSRTDAIETLAVSAAPPTLALGEEVIRAEDVFKAFDIGTQMVLVLKGVTFSVTRGDFMVLFGASGCGKSTLLHILLGLEPPTKGLIRFLGEDMYLGRSEDDRAQFRKHHIGMVYQQSNWVKSLTVLENVAFPMMLLGEDKTKSLEKAYDTLKVMKMENWANYHPMELSGGQQQRVAVARAIITDPEVLVADEPTGNLDYEAGQNLMYLLNDLNHMGKTIIMVTHDLEYIQYSKTALNMKDGRIEGIYRDKDKATLESKLTYKKADFSALEKQP